MRARRWGWRLLLTVAVLVVLAAAFAAALVNSRPGQRVVLDFALDRVRGALAGTLTVDSVRSPTLLAGAVLVGVHLGAEGGRPFLDADSVRVHYSLLRLLSGTPRIAALTVYGPHVQITRYPGEDEANVDRLVAEPALADSARVPGKPIALVSVEIRDGMLEVLAPAARDLSARIPTVPNPAGAGRLRRLGLEGVQATLRDVVVQPGAETLLDARLTALSMDLALLDRPLTIEDARGRLRFGDRGLTLDSAELRVPGSAFDATLALGPRGVEGWGLDVDLRTRGAASLTDLSWLDDRIPPGRFTGAVSVSTGDLVSVRLRGVDIQLEASRLHVDGAVDVGDAVVLRNLDVRASPLAVSRLEPWVDADIPLDGWLSGRVRLSGRTEALATEGRVTFVATGYGAGPTTADFHGTVRAARDLGLSEFHARLDPLDYETLGALLPEAHLAGTGTLEVEAEGRVDDGIRFTAELDHRLDPGVESRVRAHGSVRRAEPGRWVTDVQGDLSPLSLGLLRGVAPALDLRGDVTGSLRAVGPLDDLRVTGGLSMGGGTATLTGRVDAMAPASGYRMDVRLDHVTLSDFVARLPDPTVWSGHVVVQGKGATADSLSARASLTASASRFGGLHVDTVSAEVSAADGVLTVDTLVADLGGVHVSGGGGLGLSRDARGRARVAFRTDDLEGLRSIFRGDVVTARDTLRPVELELMRMQGIDPDTLPTQAEVAMSGALEGEVTLSGSLDLLDVTGSATVHDGVYGMDHVARAEVVVDMQRVRSDDREGRVGMNAQALQWKGRSFEEVAADMTVRGRTGEGTLDVTRSGEERYRADGSISLDTLGGGEAHFARANFAVDSLAWHLTQPATVLWDTAGVTVRDVSLTREGEDPMSVTAEGTLAWAGSSDLRVDAKGLHVERLAHIAQLEDLHVAGHLDLGLQVTGPAAAPVIEGSFDIQEPHFRALAMGSISGELQYRDREARVRLDAVDGGRRVFRASGTVPIDLALDAQGRRVVDRPMDVTVTADSLDAAVALSYLDALEDVDGVVSGDFHIGGTLDTPEPSGVLHLMNGAWSIEDLGVRHTGVEGSLTLNANRTVDVKLTSHAAGTSSIEGKVTLEPLSDPLLDLTATFQNFQAVGRRDVEGNISGQVHLGDTYLKPLLTGNLSVDHGTLFLEEFVRSAEVVDLSDPRFPALVDTAALSGRPLLEGLNNPFLQNLRANVDLSVPRDAWLRSEDMNVEMGGDLIVSYDRSKRDVVLVGDLQALRGSYTVLGRRFDVQSGTIGFIGTSGVNPTLDIEAASRVRTVEQGQLEVTATVSGTLTQPRVTLSTDEQGVAQSDLVSYLIFGRPSSQLVAGAGQGGVGSAALGATVSYATGTLATRIGTVLSQQIGLDYFNISTLGEYGVASGAVRSSFLAGTQFEVGQYLGEDVFVVLIFRTPSEQAGASNDVFGGARVEVAMTDDYNFQAFWEDRFLRSNIGALGQLDPSPKIVGVFIFREWGY